MSGPPHLLNEPPIRDSDHIDQAHSGLLLSRGDTQKLAEVRHSHRRSERDPLLSGADSSSVSSISRNAVHPEPRQGRWSSGLPAFGLIVLPSLLCIVSAEPKGSG